jgi:parallel beta-helix repeat protein
MRPFVRFTTLATLFLYVTFAHAGELNPPAGPVTSTMKPLDQIEPRIAINAVNTPGTATSLYRITQGGSYYLTANTVGSAGKNGIEVQADRVRIDLSGFMLQGVSGSLDGIKVTVGSTCHVTNGAIIAWGGWGISDPANAAMIVVNVRASENAGHGIFAGSRARVSECACFGNGADGIVTGVGSNVANCVVQGNTGSGINSGVRSVVTECTSTSNGANGISAGAGSVIIHCTASTSTDWGNGIAVTDGCTITSCSASGNAGNGIAAGSSTSVSGCTVTWNAGDGILASTGCRITDNNCVSNGSNGSAAGSGVHVTGWRNRIEGNNCSSASYGIRTEIGGNLIAGNTCSGNGGGNFNITGTQTIGPIITTAGTIVTTNPWANFQF